MRTNPSATLLAPVAFLAVCMACSVARAGDPIDITEYTDDLVVLTDGADHFVIVEPFSKRNPRPFFYGTKNRFNLVRAVGHFASGRERFSITFWEPRWNPAYHNHQGVHATLSFKDGKYTVRCDDRDTVLKPVEGDKRRLILGTGKFEGERWNRRSFSLSRDNEGTYFFVDRSRAPDSRDFRVFMGPRGALKQLKMKNIVYDSAGAIFTTDKGQLRLVLGDKDAHWVQGKKKTELIYLPLGQNRYLIYVELGVYSGERLGTPCDHM